MLDQGQQNKRFQHISGAFPVLQAQGSHRSAVWSSGFGNYAQTFLISDTAGGKAVRFSTVLWPASIPGAFCARSYDYQGEAQRNEQTV